MMNVFCSLKLLSCQSVLCSSFCHRKPFCCREAWSVFWLRVDLIWKQVVSVIWHKADVDARFDRIRQVLPHWRRLANMIELVLPLAHSSPQPKWQINRFSHFCTAHGRVSSSMPPSYEGSGPHLIHDYLGPSKPKIQTASRSVQPFYTDDCRVSCTLQWVALLPTLKLPLPMGDVDPHVILSSLGPPEFSTQTTSWSVQLFLQGSLVWQTDHTARSVTISRTYVCNNAMRPNIIWHKCIDESKWCVFERASCMFICMAFTKHAVQLTVRGFMEDCMELQLVFVVSVLAWRTQSEQSSKQRRCTAVPWQSARVWEQSSNHRRGKLGE